MYTLDQIDLAKERLDDDIERELQVRSTLCPPIHGDTDKNVGSTSVHHAMSYTCALSSRKMRGGEARSRCGRPRSRYGTLCAWCLAKAGPRATFERDSGSWSPIWRSTSRMRGWTLVRRRWYTWCRRERRCGRISGRGSAESEMLMLYALPRGTRFTSNTLCCGVDSSGRRVTVQSEARQWLHVPRRPVPG